MACSSEVAADESSTGAAGPGASQPPAHVLCSLPLLVFEHQPLHVDKDDTTTTTHDDHDNDDDVFEHQPLHADKNGTTTTTHDDDDEEEEEEDDDTEMLMFSISEGRIYTGGIPEIISTKDRICYTTPHGWVIIFHGAAPWDTWLWHPLTGETLPLPPIQDDHDIPVNASCLLTHNSVAHPDCAVLLLDVGEPNMWFCQINGESNRRWGQHTYDLGEYTIPGSPDTTPRKLHIPIIAALGGKPHFIFSESNKYKMGVVHLDFNHPSPVAKLQTLEGIDAKTVFPDGMCSGVPWLLESQGELFYVQVCFWEFDADDIGAVLVHKMDFNDGRWRRVHDIGDRVFLLPGGGGNAASCSASACNLRGNRIYFMKNFIEDDADLCIYDLEKQAMEIVPAHDLDLVLTRTEPYWIVPPI